MTVKQPENPIKWAVTVGQLKELKQRLITEYKGRNPQDWNFYDLNNNFLKGYLKRYPRCGYSAVINQPSGLTADRMISHWWGENFFEFVDTMAENFSDREAVWICTFALHQTDDSALIAEQVGTAAPSASPFARVIQGTKKTTIFVSCGGAAYGSGGGITKKVTGNVWDRLWCVYELFYSQHERADISMICSRILTDPTNLPAETDNFRLHKVGKKFVSPVELSQMLEKTLIDKIDTEHAQCSDARDRENISGEIRRNIGFKEVDKIAHHVRYNTIKALSESRSVTAGSKKFYTSVMGKLKL